MPREKIMKKRRKGELRDVYLDYAASTPIDESILKKINLLNKDFFANPSAIHKRGVLTGKMIKESRKKIADILNAHADEIIFTGGGTESIALAILGIVYTSHKEYFFRSSDEGNGSGARPFKNAPFASRLPHIVTTNIEHPAVLENCKMLEEKGLADVTYVEVEANGIVNPKKIRHAIKENTVLVSVMYVNNEIGTIQPIREIAKEIRYYRKNKSLQKYSSEMHGYFSAEKFLELPWPSRHGLGAPSRSLGISEENFLRDKIASFPFFHTDACQAMNYLEIENMDRLGVDLLSFNSSKIYGPKGIGVLYKKRGINLSPIYEGGGQEFGLRSGTENLANIVGLAEALEITEKIKKKEIERLVKLRDYAIDKLLKLNEKMEYKISLNGDPINRLPNNINISILDIKSELLVIELDAFGIYVSEKSACHSESGEVSYVLNAIRKAIGEKLNEEEGSIRISLGRQTQKKDIDYLILSLQKILKKYRQWKLD
jgi:cysteine desulfurase